MEDATSRGRVLIFEFKVVELAPEGRAMVQLLDRNYAAKYLSRGEPVFLVGVEFSRNTRDLVVFEVREAG